MGFTSSVSRSPLDSSEICPCLLYGVAVSNGREGRLSAGVRLGEGNLQRDDWDSPAASAVPRRTARRSVPACWLAWRYPIGGSEIGALSASSRFPTASEKSTFWGSKSDEQELMKISHVSASLFAWVSLLAAVSSVHGEISTVPLGNRFVHLDEPNNPWQFARGSAELITPQWIGEKGVEAVCVALCQRLQRLCGGG